MYKILIIDDEPQIVELLDKFFTPRGFEVKKTYNGKDGLAVLKKEQIDLAVIDERMPDMNGAEVIREMKKLKIPTPVVRLTGSVGTLQSKEEEERKQYCILYKPVRLAELLEVVNNLLSIKAV